MGASFDITIAQILHDEGGFNHDEKTGEIVNFGITQHFLRLIGIHLDEAHIRAMRMEDAVALYREFFWDKYHWGNFRDQAVASKLFFILINAAPEDAGRVLQAACGDCFHPIDIDGIIGSKTFAAANACDPVLLLKYIKIRGEQFYRAVDRGKPQGKLDGWLHRLWA